MNNQSIKIGGFSFSIEAQAYGILEDYMNELNRYFASYEDGADIMADVEVRMGELIAEFRGNESIVSTYHVSRAIDTFGRPEDILENTHVPQGDEGSGNKKFYRDQDRKVIAGVCAGISAYFGWDVTMVRLVFVLGAFLGVGFAGILYIALWIVAPYATNVREKLNMKGKKFNIVNLAQEIESQLDKLGDAITDLAKKVDQKGMKFF